MLRVEKICKSYKTGDFTQQVLKDVSIRFRDNEFVAILGPSGSGKTTLLNLLGGLDQYDTGDLLINETSTNRYKSKDWDAYRNNCVGFIFQSYNLIGHISVLANVEMGMTLSGINKSTRKKKALEVLDRVGLKDHAHKKPNQLSGGQMQRVAIARALVNDPTIILADEPTGALDTETSIQIMELIKEIAKDKVVIMVTHNPELAHEYASRTIELKDGIVIKDSHPYEEEKKTENFSIRKTSMSYFTALKLSFNNIRTKKGRTLITSFASSIGIIGISLILALSNGFQIQIDDFEKSTLSQMPIMITGTAIDLSSTSISHLQGGDDLEEFSDEEVVYAQEDMKETVSHENIITQDYIDYLDDVDSELVGGISYTYMAAMNLVNYDGETYSLVDGTSSWASIPNQEGYEVSSVITDNFDVLAGEIDQDEIGIIVTVDTKNQISSTIATQLGLSDDEEYTFEDILDVELKLVGNDDYYMEYMGAYIPSSDYEAMYESDDSLTAKVIAIVRANEDQAEIGAASSVAYTDALVNAIVDLNSDSNIIQAQSDSDLNIFTYSEFDDSFSKDDMLAYLGAESLPAMISIYPNDFDSKDLLTDYLDDYNVGKDAEDMIEYTDYASLISSLSGNIMSAITIVLIAFSSISLIVSSIMIGIITYISVLERTKEIGILRALGARKKDITRVFTAETVIIGLCSGLIGIGIGCLLTIPANNIIYSLTGLSNVAQLNPLHAILLIAISMILTILGGLIPSKMAAKKDPVEALRSE